MIAEINISQNNQFSLTYYQNIDGIVSNGDYNSTNTLDVSDVNEIILNNAWHYMYFFNSGWNGSSATASLVFNANRSTGLSPTATTNVKVPSGYQYLIVAGLEGSRSWATSSVSWAEFQTLKISYGSPRKAITTFYDSYPGGNITSTTSGTEAAINTQNLEPIVVSTGRRTFPSGSLDSDQNWRSSQIIDIPSGVTNISFDSASKYTLLRFDVGGDFYNSTTAPSSAGRMLTNVLQAPVPLGATQFIILAYTQNLFQYTAVSEASFGSLVIGYYKTTEYNFDYLNAYWADNGTTVSHASILSSPKVMIINDSIIIKADPTLSHIIHFWSNNKHLGWYESTINWTSSSTNRLGEMNFWNMTIPPTATHFTFGQTATNFTVSYVEPVYLEIDPPAGNKITKIALKGL